MKGAYFADTYALIEIVKGNKNYERYIEADLFTTIFNLYELFYALLRDFNEDVAKRYFYEFKNKLLEIKDEYIFAASRFKLNNIKKRFSYADSLGFAIAQANNIRFLTGDKEFKNFENVEFVP